jgi:hypothetical protein
MVAREFPKLGLGVRRNSPAENKPAELHPHFGNER